MSAQQILSFRDLDVWHAAMDLADAAFDLSEQLPSTLRFDLGSQIRKSATSVPSNIAEGHAHRGERTFLRHVRIALGSLAELDTQLELGSRRGFFEVDGFGAVRFSDRAHRSTPARSREVSDEALASKYRCACCHSDSRISRLHLVGAACASLKTRFANPEPRTPSPESRAPDPESRERATGIHEPISRGSR